MMTPNRNGLSALPGDLFFTQVIDINYVAGLTWTRQPGMRVLFHPSKKVTFGVSLENNPISTSAVRRAARHYAACRFAWLGNAQLDNAPEHQRRQNVLNHAHGRPTSSRSSPSIRSPFHFEVGGIESNFKIVNPVSRCASTSAKQAPDFWSASMSHS